MEDGARGDGTRHLHAVRNEAVEDVGMAQFACDQLNQGAGGYLAQKREWARRGGDLDRSFLGAARREWKRARSSFGNRRVRLRLSYRNRGFRRLHGFIRRTGAAAWNCRGI